MEKKLQNETRIQLIVLSKISAVKSCNEGNNERTE